MTCSMMSTKLVSLTRGGRLRVNRIKGGSDLIRRMLRKGEIRNRRRKMVINTRSCPSRLKESLICYRIWITMWLILLLIPKSMRWCHHLLLQKWESLDSLTKWGCRISKDYQSCQRSLMVRLKMRTAVEMLSKTTPKLQMWSLKETKVTTNPTQMLTL